MQSETSVKHRGDVRFAAVAGLVLLLLCAEPALAQRRGKSSRYGRANAAQKQQQIAQLQKQLDRAKELLDSVTSKSQMSQSEINAARQAAISSRQELEADEKVNKTVSEKIRKIEEGILESQSDDSEFAKSVDRIDEARRAMDVEMHHTLRRPPPAADEDEATRLSEVAHLTAEERDQIAQSSTYAQKKEALFQAVEHMNAVKTKLFQASSEWKKAHEEHHKAEQEKAKDERSVQGAANDGSDARAELKTMAQIAASARTTIAQAEGRLRSLGAKPSTSSSQTPDPKKPNTKK